ncbi:putative C-type lectin domain family 20 member A [Toxotes jaculatrix]|uniref:putative C-type lectin domain family 20 member A n=1 Tax=Toxotes jaculatrix TaxID=941984 RepID=UPI001B3AA212|nr:putative C-type lectin domain family 20 member A [Toxotes jaculatrix]
METTGVVILLLLAQSTLSLGTTREYHLVQLLKNWTEAQSYCREHFVDLATIETAEDWDRVKTIFDSSGQRAWIGLYNDVKDWKWSLNDTYLYRDGNTEVRDWFGSDFDNYQGLEWCMEMHGTGALNDLGCNYLRRSMCYNESTNEHIPVTEPMTWVSAQQNCRDKYTDLTSIRDEQEREKIRIPMMKVLKVVVSSEGSVDLNDPLVQEALLNHMTKRMKDSRIPQKFRLSWRKQPNGKVFN